MEELWEYRQKMTDRFEAVVDDLEQAVENIPPQEYFSPLEPGGWNLHQVLVHLRDAEAHAFLPRIELILSQDHPYLENFDDEAWMAAHYDPAEPVKAVLDEYRRLRRRELKLLRLMPARSWSRAGLHPVQRVRSLQWWVEYSLSHAEEHLRQIRREG